MKTDEITVHVPAEVADAYRAASEQDRRKMELLISLQLAEFFRSAEPLEEVLDEISREAQQRGLTPAILDSILHE